MYTKKSFCTLFGEFQWEGVDSPESSILETEYKISRCGIIVNEHQSIRDYVKHFSF